MMYTCKSCGCKISKDDADPELGGGYCCDCDDLGIPSMQEERDRLLKWKKEALIVIEAWEKVGDALEVEKIGLLGDSKAAIALREVQRLKALEGGK